jgi:hypothetical protein
MLYYSTRPGPYDDEPKPRNRCEQGASRPGPQDSDPEPGFHYVQAVSPEDSDPPVEN